MFGEVAELYDASRPTYPKELIDDLVAWAGEPPRALEIGAGTGKATRLMAQRGVSVVAVEPSAAMAAIARRSTAAHPSVEVVESDFERFDAGGERFALAYAAQAWHWVDHATGYPHARAVLREGGRLVAFWNRPAWEQTTIRDALRAAYQEIAPEMPSGGSMHASGSSHRGSENVWCEEIAAVPEFADAELRDYEWAAPYTPDRFATCWGRCRRSACSTRRCESGCWMPLGR